MKRPTCRRVGFAALAALTCLLIVVAIVASMLQGAIHNRRQLHIERNCRQSEMLLAAGAERAAARLASDPTFRGDVWELPADEIVGRGAGRVTTQVSRSNDPGLWQVQIVAEYPLGRDFPIQRSQTFQIRSSTVQAQE
jgi:type II secretory pathway component PulK